MTASPQAGDSAAAGRRQPRGDVWAVVSVLFTTLAFLPTRPGMPSATLDASWGAFLHEAARRHWQFGRDIDFTYGPLGYLAVPMFAPDVFWWSVAFRAAIGASCGWAFHVLARRAGWSSAAIPIALALLLPPTLASFDLPWLLPAMLWPIVATGDSRLSRVASTMLAVVVAAVALVKFTTFVLASALAGLLVVEDVRRRRLPIRSLAYGAAVAALWILAGQSPMGFATWLHGSWQTAAGYNEAMSTPIGPYQRRELLVFATVAAAILLAHVRQGWWLRAAARPGWAPTGALGLLLFVQFKLGFVRQDAHVTAALSSLPLIATLGVAPMLAAGTPRRWRQAAAIVVCLAFAAYAYGLRRHFDRLAPPEHYRAFYAFQIDAIRDALHPVQTHRRLAAAYAHALDTLRAATPLPVMDGTVDMYGHGQAALLAHPLLLATRPVFQSYGTYLPALAARNRAFLEGPRGPRHVLFTAETIDFRYPLTDEGASLPTLLGQFDVASVADRWVHLERRRRARTETFVPGPTFEVRPGVEFSLPSSEAPLWATIDIAPTLFGRIAGLVYKLPPLVVDVRTADGTVNEYRLIRAIAADRMLVSPLVTSTDDLLALLRRQPSRPGARVIALRLRPAWPAAYADRVTIRLSTLAVSAD